MCTLKKITSVTLVTKTHRCTEDLLFEWLFLLWQITTKKLHPNPSSCNFYQKCRCLASISEHSNHINSIDWPISAFFWESMWVRIYIYFERVHNSIINVIWRLHGLWYKRRMCLSIIFIDQCVAFCLCRFDTIWSEGNAPEMHDYFKIQHWLQATRPTCVPTSNELMKNKWNYSDCT